MGRMNMDFGGVSGELWVVSCELWAQGELSRSHFTSLNDNQYRVLQKDIRVSARNLIFREEIANILQISTSAVQKHIASLKQKDIIKRIGLDFGGHWQVCKWLMINGKGLMIKD